VIRRSVTVRVGHDIAAFGFPAGQAAQAGRLLDMGVQRMDNVGIVVDDLPAAIAFFRELGLELEGEATIEGDWAGRVTGLRDQRVEIAMMRTPDGHSRLELSRFPRRLWLAITATPR
jgi:hypothetical protein